MDDSTHQSEERTWENEGSGDPLSMVSIPVEEPECDEADASPRETNTL